LFVFGATAPIGPGPPHSRGFYITHDAPVGRNPLDEWSACRRDLWQHTTITTDRHPCPRWDSNPHSQHTYALDRVATRTGKSKLYYLKFGMTRGV